jgi:hypothetical protein
VSSPLAAFVALPGQQEHVLAGPLDADNRPALLVPAVGLPVVGEPANMAWGERAVELASV